MNLIARRINELKSSLPANCTLIAVSKTKPSSDIQSAYDAGQKDFGENKVQELSQKAEELPNDIQWHMIGHLQRNKVKYIASFVHLIHGVDSLKLLKEIDKQGNKANRIIDCLLQIHIAEEETKFGLNQEELMEILNGNELKELANVRIRGLMGMATFTEDKSHIAREFSSLKGMFESIKSIELTNAQIDTLSMGMSGDYSIAVEQGSNMVRVGSAIFGARN